MTERCGRVAESRHGFHRRRLHSGHVSRQNVLTRGLFSCVRRQAVVRCPTQSTWTPPMHAVRSSTPDAWLNASCAGKLDFYSGHNCCCAASTSPLACPHAPAAIPTQAESTWHSNSGARPDNNVGHCMTLSVRSVVARDSFFLRVSIGSARFRRHSRQPAIRPVLRTRQAYRGMRRLRADRVDSIRVVRLPASARSSHRMASAPRRLIP